MDKNHKILVVEDNPQLQQLYITKLDTNGFTTFGVATGEDAVKQAQEHKPDLILLDVMLTGDMNGFDTLEVLKRDDALKNIPVIMLTNLDTEEAVAKKIGAVDYLVKVNLDLDDIVKKIRQYLAE